MDGGGNLAKPCTLVYCPGDNGRTSIMWFGRLEHGDKGDPRIGIYSLLESASSLLKLYAGIGCEYSETAEKLAEAITCTINSIATGRDWEYALDRIRSALRGLPKPNYLGWVTCRSLCCALADTARTLIRLAEFLYHAWRRIDQGVGEDAPVASILNRLSNAVFEIVLRVGVPRTL